MKVKFDLNPTISTVNNNIQQGTEMGVLQLTTTDGSKLNNLTNFSSYSYLGLENSEALKRAVCETVREYGTQFGYSRSFLQLDLYEKTEYLLSQIFQHPCLLAPSTTLAHQAVMPVLVNNKDAVIIDQQAHASMHYAVKNLQQAGVKVELVRHNRTDLLEEKIKTLRQKHGKVWYLADSIYSMYGDYAPLADLEVLLNKYNNFHLYVDDAHGMSWTGEKGKGYVLEKMELHPQMILVTSLNKAFAGAGGVIVVPDKAQKQLIRNCGGTLIFSTPIQPPMLGANIASAQLHLDEIATYQQKLKQNIAVCRQQIAEHNLLDISASDSPVFYLPTSLPKVSYNLTQRLMKEGFYVTPTLFPAVSMRRAGIRYCISAEHSESEVKTMIAAMAHHYPKAIAQENYSLSAIKKAFKINASLEKKKTKTTEFNLKVYRSIKDINPQKWNGSLGLNGAYNYEALKVYESAFKGGGEKEKNFDFFYVIITDNNDNWELATFFTRAWVKDDVFKSAEISAAVEKQRKKDPYYLCSEAFFMGTAITEGEHLYLRNSKNNKPLLMLFEWLDDVQQRTGVNAVYLRDFDEKTPLADLFLSNGFVKVDLPDFTNILNLKNVNEFGDLLAKIPRKKRKEIKSHCINFEEKYTVKVKYQVSDNQLKKYIDLYKNVKQKSFVLNTFDLPNSFFQKINESKEWEMLELTLAGSNKLAAVVFCNNPSGGNYTPQFIGLNYELLYSHKVYKQAIYQLVKRAIYLGKEKVYFGITATTEKKRFGAKPLAKVAFVQVQDMYNLDELNLISGNAVKIEGRV